MNGKLITFLIGGIVVPVAAAVSFNTTISETVFSTIAPLLSLGR